MQPTEREHVFKFHLFYVLMLTVFIRPTASDRGETSVAFVGRTCYTCSDGCERPREPTMGVMMERCDESKDQTPLCASFFDPVDRRMNYGRGCLRITDRPDTFHESECQIMDVADFWNPRGPKRKTCVCLCSFDGCNYDEMCYNPSDTGTDLMRMAPSAGLRDEPMSVFVIVLGLMGIMALSHVPSSLQV